MVKGTHRGSVKDGTGAVRLLGGAETSRRATAPRRQPPHGVGKRWRQSRSLTRQSPSAVALFLSKKGKHVRREAAWRVSNASTSRCNSLGSVVLTLDELRQITNNFSDDQLLGKGAFGKVYKGVLTNGDMIAVKRFASTITGLEDVQYETEAQHLMRLKHPNIVQLVGYCSETEVKLVRHNGNFVRAEKPERLLCLEYMPKGSLRGHLSDETSGLEWNTRYKIIEGICYGLHYLHEEWQATPIIHMDLKPANILLDDNMVPKIADFGLSRLFGEEQTRTCTTSCKGTPGYMAPEYIEKGLITKKFDIFSLGVIIIEIITGLKDYPTDETETASQQYIDLVLNNWRHRLRKAQGYTSQDIDYQQIKKCIQIGLLCVKVDWAKRPTINQIIKMLDRSDEAYQNEREVEQLLLETRLLSPVTSKYVDEEAQRRFRWFKRAVEQDLFQQGQTWTEPWDSACETLYEAYSQWLINGDFPGRCDISTNKPWFIVPFIRRCGQWRWDWNLESMKGMRAVGDPSSLLLVPRQLYVGLKKTLELEDDGNGNRWRAHEYTTLLPSDDGSNKLIAAISLRVEFKASSTRSITGAPKDGPKIAPRAAAVWEHFTKVHVKVATNTNADASQRKKPCTKVMYVICHHCDSVFKADHGTSHLRRHLSSRHTLALDTIN